MNQTRLFISHAGADKPLVDLFRDALVLSGLPKERIFYSSDRGTGIPAGEGSRAVLKATLATRPLVLSLITTTFATRAMCWMELGAAWALDLPTFPIIVPPMTRDRASSGLGDAQVGTLGSPQQIGEVFDDLHGRIAHDLDVSLPNTSWNPAVERFRAEFARLTPSSADARPRTRAAGIDQTFGTSQTTTPSASGPRREVKPGLIVSKDRVVPGRRGLEILGTIQNDSRNTRRSIWLRGTLYDVDDEILATTSLCNVDELAPGESKTFQLRCTSPVPDAHRHDVQIERVSE